MQGYEQPPGDPLGDPLMDPFDAMFDSLTGGAYPLDPTLTGDIQGPLAGAEMDSDETLDRLERDIEATPPAPDDIGRTLDRLEESIEKTLPIELKNLMPLGEDIKDLLSEADQIGFLNDVFVPAGTDDQPPLPYYLQDPQGTAPSNAPPHRKTDSIGRRGGRGFKSSQPGRNDEEYCPIEDRYVSQDFCEDKDCEYYVKDSEGDWHCAYHDDEES